MQMYGCAQTWNKWNSFTVHGATPSTTKLTLHNGIVHSGSTVQFTSTNSACTLISQTFKEDKLIYKDSCLTHQLAYVRVKGIYISLSEYKTMMATLPLKVINFTQDAITKDQFCSGLWQQVSAGPLMAEDRSDWEANGSSSSHTAVECLQQESQMAH